MWGRCRFFRHSISSGSSSSSDDSDNMPSKARQEATNARLKGHCLLCIVHSPAKPLGISRYLSCMRYLNVSFAAHFSNMPYFRQSQSLNANTDFHQIWSIYSTTLHINADKFLSSYIKYKYHFFMFEKNPITFEQGCTCTFSIFVLAACGLYYGTLQTSGRSQLAPLPTAFSRSLSRVEQRKYQTMINSYMSYRLRPVIQ